MHRTDRCALHASGIDRLNSVRNFHAELSSAPVAYFVGKSERSAWESPEQTPSLPLLSPGIEQRAWMVLYREIERGEKRNEGKSLSVGYARISGFNLAGIRRTRAECKKVLEYRRQTFGELSTAGIRLADMDDGSGCSMGELNSEGCHEGRTEIKTIRCETRPLTRCREIARDSRLLIRECCKLIISTLSSREEINSMDFYAKLWPRKSKFIIISLARNSASI